MNVLYLAPFVPYPPDKGERIRAFHLIRHLAREHAVHVACLAGGEDDSASVAALAEHCASVDAVHRRPGVSRLLRALALLTATPFTVASALSPRLRRRVARKLRTQAFDAIVVFSAAMGAYVRHVQSVPKVIDFVDVESELWRRYADHHRPPYSWIYRREAACLARHEDQLARAFDHAVFVSNAEASLFGRRAGDRPVSVITNGVDLEYFAPADGGPPSADPAGMVFAGTMDYFPNVDAVEHFCERILPLVRAELPGVRFSVVGRNPTGPVEAYGRQQRVEVTGAVPDVRPYLARAAVFVAPLRVARGVQNKVLEAMAMGVPVVGTSNAFLGVDATEGDGVRIADDPTEFARAVLALLTDPEHRRRCARRARSYVEHRHRWADHGARLASLVRAAAARA
jgi:sugar transferase (PEP-CTERM/EpsH1 system associated)